jgi:hypothetical protein
MASLKVIRSIYVLAITSILYVGCKKSDTAPAPEPAPVNPCIGITISPTADAGATITSQSIGTITVKSPIGTGFTYSIGNNNFQSSVNFANLAAGSYTVTAKNANGCTGTTTVTIGSYGPKYFLVKNLITFNCGPCHLNGASSGGRNFDTDANIVAAWERIKVRTVDGLPSFMPQGGQFTAADKQKMVDWVNAGHRITD